MARFCEYCGTELQGGSLICSQCGAILSGDAYVEQEVPQSVQESSNVQIPQPESEQTPIQEEVQKPIKKKKGKKWLIPVAAVAAVAAAGALLWQPVLKMVAPQAYVGLMLKNTNSALEQRLENTPAGILSNSACLDNGSMEIEVNYVDDYEGEIKAGIALHSNVEEQKWQLNADISAMGVDADFSAYMDSNVFAIGSDALTGGDFYGLTYDSFEDDLRSSAFADMLDDESIEIMTTLVDAIDDSIDTAANIEERLEPYMDVITEYIKGLESENGSEKIELSGKEHNCSTVAFTIDQGDLVDMLGEMLELLEDEPEFKDLSEMLESTGENAMSDAMDDLRDALDEVNDAVDADAVVTYYVYNSKIVNVKIAVELGNPDGDETIEAELNICYGANPKKDDVVIEGTVKVDGEKVTAKAVVSDGWDGDVYTSKISVSAKAAGEKVADLDQITEWNKESGDLTLSIAMEDEEISCSFKLLETENGCQIAIDDLYAFMCEIAPDFAYNDPFTCSVKMTFSEGAAIDTPTFTNLDKIDQDALEGIMEDVQSFVTDNEDVFGSIGGAVEDDYYEDYEDYEDVYVDDWI